MDEFEAYKKMQQKGFEEYKSAGEEYVLKITKSFDLQAGNVVSFDDDKAVENPLDNKKEVYDDLMSFPFLDLIVFTSFAMVPNIIKF